MNNPINYSSNIKKLINFFNKNWYFILAIFIFLIILLLLIFYPECYIYTHFNSLTKKEKLDGISNIRTFFGQLLVSFTLLITALIAWVRYQEEKKLNRNKIDQDQYIQAITLFTDKDIHNRIAGIFLLDTIMNSKKEFHNKVVQLLCLYISSKRKSIISEYADNKLIENQLLKKLIPDNGEKIEKVTEKLNNYRKDKVDPDIQQILEILGKRKSRNIETVGLKDKDKIRVDIRDSCLSNVRLSFANFEDSIFIRVFFGGIDSFLPGINFRNSDLRQSIFDDVDLRSANFDNANLENVSFLNCKFEDDKSTRDLNKIVNQFSAASTLYNTKFDDDIKKAIEEKYPDLFKKI